VPTDRERVLWGAEGLRKYNGCAEYSDYRELLEKQKGVDAVVVCTTDNLHAAVSAAAMKKRKHVFCQKPLTHTIYEARDWRNRALDGSGNADCGGKPSVGSDALALRMDLGRSDRTCARGAQLVEPALLAARN